MRFSGHESFACRYAWLPKAFRAIVQDPTAFQDVEQAMVRLGVGKNMVRSIRFWVEVMGVAAPRAEKTLAPTGFGQAIFAEEGFDPFLEDVRTLWLVVYLLVADNAAGPLATRLRRANQPVLSTRNLFSTPRPSLLASL